MNRNDLARDTINGALVLLSSPLYSNGYGYWFVRYLDNDQKAAVPVEELRPVRVGPERERA